MAPTSRFGRAALLASLPLCVSLSPGWAEPNDSLPAWQTLRYQASKLLMKAHSSVTVSARSREALEKQLWEGGDDVLPLPEEVLEVSIESRFLGRFSESTLYLDPRSDRALARTQIDTGKRHRKKTYRFARRGVWSRRLAPLGREEEQLPPEEWTDLSENFDEYLELPSDSVGEPGVLFYLFSREEPSSFKGGRDLVFYSKSALHRVTVIFEGATEIKTRYSVRSAAGEEERRGRVPALHVAVRAAAEQEEAGGELELLGLEGDIDLYIDPETGAPLRIVGRIPPVGEVAVQLVEMVLSPSDP